MLVPRIQVFVTEDAVGDDSSNSFASLQLRAILLQDAVLHGAGMCRRNQTVAVYVRLFGHKCIVIVARRMALREIQTFEHMELVVDFARLLDTVAHAVKYTANAFNLGT